MKAKLLERPVKVGLLALSVCLAVAGSMALRPRPALENTNVA